VADRIEFGRRRPAPPPQAQPAGDGSLKRSRHVALLMMGAFAVGGGAYAVTGRQACQPAPPPAADAAAPVQPGGGCTSRGYTGYSGRLSSLNFFSSGDSSSRATGGSEAASSGVSRGGFGSFARAFGFGGG
jgi:hypothetical protein